MIELKIFYFCRVIRKQKNVTCHASLVTQKITINIKTGNTMKKKEEISQANIEKMKAETWKIFKELAKSSKENEKWFKETRKLIKEFSNEYKEHFKEISKDHQEAIKRMKQQEKMIGGISRSNGEFCEEYFINSFKENPTFMGETFERVMTNLYPDPVVINDEYDLVLRNGKTIVLIEMKYKAGIDNVGKMFSKLHSYRANYPMFKDYKIYLCLASFRFPATVRERAAKEGIVLIQQRGEKIEIVSENVRTW